MAISSECNTSSKVTEQLSNYKDLQIEINSIRGAKTIPIPMVVGVLGLVNKRLGKYTDKIFGTSKYTKFRR